MMEAFIIFFLGFSFACVLFYRHIPVKVSQNNIVNMCVQIDSIHRYLKIIVKNNVGVEETINAIKRMRDTIKGVIDQKDFLTDSKMISSFSINDQDATLLLHIKTYEMLINRVFDLYAVAYDSDNEMVKIQIRHLIIELHSYSVKKDRDFYFLPLVIRIKGMENYFSIKKDDKESKFWKSLQEAEDGSFVPNPN